MISILISSLLGAFALQVATLEDPRGAVVSVWPPGSTIYLGDSVLLRCSVQLNSSSAWSFQWYRYKAPVTAPPSPRHLVRGESYSITAVTREDGGAYWCKAERTEGNTSAVVLESRPTNLMVSEWPSSSLTVTPSTRLIFRGESFTVECPPPSSSSQSWTNSTGWRLKHFSPAFTGGATAVEPEQCPPHGGAAASKTSDMCTFTAAAGSSGLYWCESTEGRSNAVNITGSYGDMILKTPASPVLEGDEVVLSCQSSKRNHDKFIFFKNGEEISDSTSASSDKVTELRIEKVTVRQEGFYKCAAQDRKTESPESWLAVRGNVTTTDGASTSTSGSWRWILLTCGVLLLCVTPLTIWLIYHHRYRLLWTRSCWPRATEEVPVVALPATKQDVTEVQWDLSWMEMSSLLDKHLYPGT